MIGAYSDHAGSSGSALVLGEVQGGLLNDKWAIVRETSAVGADLTFKYGPSANHVSNPDQMRLTSDGKLGVGTTDPVQAVTIAGPDDSVNGPTLRLQNPNNPFEAGRVRFCESSTNFLGGYLHYDGSANLLHLGAHNSGSVDVANDENALTVRRSTAHVGIGALPGDARLTVEQPDGGTALRVAGSDNQSAAVMESSMSTSGSALEVVGHTSSPALRVRTDASGGNAASFSSDAQFGGSAVSITQTGDGRCLALTQTDGAGSTEALRINARGSDPAQFIDHNGTGMGLLVETQSSAGTIAEFRVPGNVRARLTTTGSLQIDGSVTTPAADYAEWLPRADVSESFEAGDVVAVRGGQITKRPGPADSYMVISTNPAMLGNAPAAGDEAREGYEMVAFLGQVPVKVLGPVQEGDLILATGARGIATAIDPSDMQAGWLPLVVGRAWESHEGEGVALVNVSIGIDQVAAANGVIASLAERLERRDQQLGELVARLEAVERALTETR